MSQRINYDGIFLTLQAYVPGGKLYIRPEAIAFVRDADHPPKGEECCHIAPFGQPEMPYLVRHPAAQIQQSMVEIAIKMAEMARGGPRVVSPFGGRR